MSSTLYGVPDDFDIIVIGGGPAGATTAGLLAKSGRRVMVLDRERHPRYHIGESLIPAVMRPMAELGLTELMDNRGFERKYGGSLVWGNNKIPWNFSFIKGGPYQYAYHTRRADFDALVLNRARQLGAHVMEEVIVKDAVQDENGRVVGVRYQLRGSEEVREARASLVVDASGQARVLSRKFSEVTWHEELRNVAVWTYFDNCERLPGDEWTNILIEGLEEGWFWAIPIEKDNMSVGYVTRTERAGASDQSLQELFDSERERTTKLKGLLRNARQASAFRTARDWSYTAHRFYGDGWVLVGDSAAFVDPLFSTGVALATLAGSTLAKIIDKILDHPAIEQEALGRYAENYRAFFDEIRTFVEKFYDQTKHKEFYYGLAQELVDPEKKNEPSKDFVTLISGLSGRHPMFHINLDDLIEKSSPIPAGS
jgi:flavin-dependent dehydrogenase